MRRVYWNVKTKARQSNREELLGAERPLCGLHQVGSKGIGTALDTQEGGVWGSHRQSCRLYLVDAQPDASFGQDTLWPPSLSTGAGNLPVLAQSWVTPATRWCAVAGHAARRCFDASRQDSESAAPKKVSALEAAFCVLGAADDWWQHIIKYKLWGQRTCLRGLVKFQVWLVTLGLLQWGGNFLQKQCSRESDLKISGGFIWTEISVSHPPASRQKYISPGLEKRTCGARWLRLSYWFDLSSTIQATNLY